MHAGPRGGGCRATALLLRVKEPTGGDSSAAAGVQSGLGCSRENFQVREKRGVFSGSAGGRPTPARAPQLGATAGFGHGAGLGGLRHGREAAAEFVTHDSDAQRGAAAEHPGRDSRPRGARLGCRGDQGVSRQVSGTRDQCEGIRVSKGSDTVHPG